MLPFDEPFIIDRYHNNDLVQIEALAYPLQAPTYTESGGIATVVPLGVRVRGPRIKVRDGRQEMSREEGDKLDDGNK